jgi:hypothetical protein
MTHAPAPDCCDGTGGDGHIGGALIDIGLCAILQ